MTTVFRPPPVAHRPPSGLALWWLVPLAVRLQLRSRVPLDARVIDDTVAVVVQVGPSAPVRWLILSADNDGRVRCRLWELRRTAVRDLAEIVVESDRLTATLQRWATEFGLSSS